MKLSPLIHDGNTYGQFVTLEPNMTVKQVCDAKRLLRNSIEVNDLPIKDIVFVVNDAEGKVGWRATAVDVTRCSRGARGKTTGRSTRGC